jgi:hypothetical protein
MNHLKPLSAHSTNDPVLFINTQAARADLTENAERRLGSAKDLMHALCCMTIKNGADGDTINAIADATYLLLSDAQDLFRAATANTGGKLND